MTGVQTCALPICPIFIPYEVTDEGSAPISGKEEDTEPKASEESDAIVTPDQPSAVEEDH